MKIVKISKTVGRTINLGNFNSLRLESFVEATVDETEDLEAANVALFTQLLDEINKDWKRYNSKKDSQQNGNV